MFWSVLLTYVRRDAYYYYLMQLIAIFEALRLDVHLEQLFEYVSSFWTAMLCVRGVQMSPDSGDL